MISGADKIDVRKIGWWEEEFGGNGWIDDD